MDDSITVQKSPLTLADAVAQSAPRMAPLPHPAHRRANKTTMIIGTMLTLGILIFGFLYLRSSMQPKEVAMTPITPTTIPSPTSQPNVSRISTTSAFMSYSAEVASFSAILNAFSLIDATLVPPILDIALDLEN